MADFDFQSVNLALRLAKKSASDDGGGGGGGSAAHMPIPGGDGEMGAVGGTALHDMVSNFFDCLGEMGKFPGVLADLSENFMDSILPIAGIDSTILDNLTHGFKKMCVNIEMHGIMQPVSGLNELVFKGLGTSVIPGVINSNQGK
jgi:hypothetical protein